MRGRGIALTMAVAAAVAAGCSGGGADEGLGGTGDCAELADEYVARERDNLIAYFEALQAQAAPTEIPDPVTRTTAVPNEEIDAQVERLDCAAVMGGLVCERALALVGDRLGPVPDELADGCPP